MSRVLVTGGAGFIGSHLVDYLVKKHQVFVVDNLSTGNRKNLDRRSKLIVMDIRSPRLKSIFKTIKPKYVFHLAAQMNVRASIDDPLYDASVNVLGSLNVIQSAIATKVRKFIFSSTGGAIYGEQKNIPIRENATARPEAPYGIAKLSVENYLNYFTQAQGLSSICLRYANVYGPRQNPKGEAGVVAIFSERLRDKKPITIFGDGSQTRDYIFVEDVARANLAAMRSSYRGQLNIGTGIETSVNRLLVIMAGISGKKTLIKHQPAIPGELMRNAILPTKASRILRWSSRIRLTEGLKTTLESYGLHHV